MLVKGHFVWWEQIISANVLFYRESFAIVEMTEAARTSLPLVVSPLWSVSAVSPAPVCLSAASASPAAGPGFLQPLAPASAWFQSNSSLFVPVKAAHQRASGEKGKRHMNIGFHHSVSSAHACHVLHCPLLFHQCIDSTRKRLSSIFDWNEPV